MNSDSVEIQNFNETIKDILWAYTENGRSEDDAIDMFKAALDKHYAQKFLKLTKELTAVDELIDSRELRKAVEELFDV